MGAASPIRRVATVGAAVLLIAGCGDSGDSGEEAITAEDVEALGPLVDGVEAKDPQRATRCLEQAGFTVTSGGAPEGADTRLELSGTGMGALNWYASQEEALAANLANGDRQEPGTVVGAKGEVAYVLGPADDPSKITSEVLPCI